jgi:hypothetical protein
LADFGTYLSIFWQDCPSVYNAVLFWCWLQSYFFTNSKII